MKKIFFLLLFLSLAEVTFAQTVESSTELPESIISYNTVEVKPEFQEDPKGFLNFVMRHFKFPEDEKLNGKIEVQFVIEKDGSITNIKVLRDLGHGTANEAVRVLKKCPKWIPGKLKGVPVRVLYSLPINLST